MSNHEIAWREFEKVSYLALPSKDSRIIPLFRGYLGNGEWEQWVGQNGALIRLKMTDLVEGVYYSKDYANKQDAFIPFVDFMLKRAYYPDTVHFINGIIDDILNLCASLEKIQTHFTCNKQNTVKVTTRYYLTDLEYIVKACRSMFDLLQEVISRIWKKTISLENGQKSNEIKSTFSKIVLHDKKLQTEDEIIKKYNLPQPLAAYYVKHSEFFSGLENIVTISFIMV